MLLSTELSFTVFMKALWNDLFAWCELRHTHCFFCFNHFFCRCCAARLYAM